jgi:hypothetical protein
VIYGIASAGARTSAEAEKIKALQPVFETLGEDVLHAWVESGEDIGPKIGVAGISENILRGLSRYHLNLFERRRQTLQMSEERKTKVWANRIAGAGAGAAIATLVILLLERLGVF